MKKLCMLIICIGTLTLNAVHAQFNENFDPKAVVWSLVKCDKGDFCTISETGFRRYDFNGGLLWERYYSNLPFMTANGNTSPVACRLVHTDDDGVIYFSTDGNSLNPVAVKIDAAGSVVWAREYYCTPSLVYIFTNFIRVDGERMPMDEENYIFTTTGSPTTAVSSPYNQPNTIDVLRIDKNGDLIWNRKYYENPGGDYFVKDLTNTLSYAGVSKKGIPLYYLAGVRVEYPKFGAENYSMYQMMIDFDGNIVDPYQVVNICSYPFGIDAMYDKDYNSVITAVTMGDCGLVGSPTASQIGIISTDESLSVTSYNYYWMPNTNENYTSRIEKTDKTKYPGYVVSGWSYDHNIYAPWGDYSGARNMTLLKIDALGTPLFYKHYMVGEDAGLAADLIVNQDPSSGEDVYVMSSITAAHGTTNNYARLVGTDPNGDVCGVHNFDIKWDKTSVSPKPKEYTYVKYEKYDKIELKEEINNIQYDKCKYNTQYGYKPTGINDIQNKNSLLKIYPTALTYGQNTINMMSEEANASGTTITVTAIDGRKLLEQQIGKVNANEVIHMDVSSLNTGNYIISVKSKDGKLNTTSKISKM